MAEPGGIAAAQLRQIVERIERIEEEIGELNADKRDIYAEAKANGFDVKVLKRVVALRRQDDAERQEMESLLDLYLHALGMRQDDDDGSSRVHAHAREGASA